MNEINKYLKDIAQETLDQIVDLEYDQYIDEMCANHEMMLYAAHSYDNDAQCYGCM